MIWKASAPSNIALIKYMGKLDTGKNQATNPSLSMTLSKFRTHVEIEEKKGLSEDVWMPLDHSSPLRRETTKKFMDFFTRLKNEAGVKDFFEVRSGNNFPSDAGLASSASSFAALTLVTEQLISHKIDRPMRSLEQQALISRSGSGSSCRSFFGPWCGWEGDQIGIVESKLPPLTDFVIVMEEGFKKVSSSEAHKRVKTSPLFAGRPERAEIRMHEAKEALASGDFKKLAEISWEDLWDMHSLFHTSQPPFFYFAPKTIEVLRFVENFWEKHGDGPIATIDAGPNVHLLVPTQDADRYRKEFSQITGVKILESGA